MTKQACSTMKIIYHHRTQGTGVEGVHIRGIVNGFRELGHNVCIVSPPGVNPEKPSSGNSYAKKTGGLSKVLSWVSRNLPQPLFEALELFYNFRTHRKIVSLIKRDSIDFIYERHSFFSFAAVRLAKKFNIPIIIEVNEVAGEKRVRKQCFVGLAKKTEKYVFDNADAIVVVSGFLKDKIKEYGINKNKIIIMPNAVNPGQFSPEFVDAQIIKKYHKNGAVRVGFIGSFIDWHNIELLVDTFERISKERNVLLFLVGDGVLKRKIQDIVINKKIEDKVIFTGSVPHKDIPTYISLMDICVIPQSNEYRSPIKMFEYMAMSKAIIAPRIGPVKDVLTDGVSGVLFDMNDHQSLKQCIVELVDNREKREEIGANARSGVLTQHTWVKNSEKIIGIHHTLKRKKSVVWKRLKPLRDDFYSSYRTVQSKIAYTLLPGNCNSILEIGCSSGYFSKYLKQKAKKVYGLDVNEDHIDKAKKRYPDINFQVADASRLPFTDKMFDAVVMLEVFEHLKDREKIVKEICRVLKPNGTLVLSTPNTGLFQFLDPFNLKALFKKMFPQLITALSTKLQKYRNTQFTNNLTWHGHYSLESLKKFFEGRLAIEKIKRGGLLIFPLSSLLYSVLIRIAPARGLLTFLQTLMNLDGAINYGRWAYNLVVRARKV